LKRFNAACTQGVALSAIRERVKGTLQALNGLLKQVRRHRDALNCQQFNFIQALTGVGGKQLWRFAIQGEGKALNGTLHAVERLIGQAGERCECQKRDESENEAETRSNSQ
jgi:hypothetical protein